MNSKSMRFLPVAEPVEAVLIELPDTPPYWVVFYPDGSQRRFTDAQFVASFVPAGRRGAAREAINAAKDRLRSSG